MTTKIKPKPGWFEVDRDGLKQQLARRPKSFIVLELIQNALDEEGVTEVVVRVRSGRGRDPGNLLVRDDAPNGFLSLIDAYTLFRSSYKKADPEKRGRFNVGEKFALAVADCARITTTTGTVLFDARGRHDSVERTKKGSEIELSLPLAESEVDEILATSRSVIVPANVLLLVNGEQVPSRYPISVTEQTLPTEISDESGNLRPTQRKTKIEIFEIESGREGGGWLYECGIPVVQTGDPWDVNILQKIPLNLDRDNVTPSYLRTIRVHVANEMAEEIEDQDANAVCFQDALSDPRIEKEAAQSIIEGRFGPKYVSKDLSDLEANSIAVSKGYTLIHGRSLSAQAWENVRRLELVQPAGQVTPSSKVLSSADGEPPITPTVDMQKFADYVSLVGRHLLNKEVSVQFYNINNGHAAWYGSGRISFNLRSLGHSFFSQEKGNQEQIDALLIHEFAHEVEGNHLDEIYHGTLCLLGARLRTCPHLYVVT